MAKRRENKILPVLARTTSVFRLQANGKETENVEPVVAESGDNMGLQETSKAANPPIIEEVAESSAKAALSEQALAGSKKLDGQNKKISDVGLNQSKYVSDKLTIITNYWQQIASESRAYKKSMSGKEVRKYLEDILKDNEVENKDKVRQEVYFIINHFRLRRCGNYCKKTDSFYHRVSKALRKVGISHLNKEYCECGLEKCQHTERALTNTVKSWHMRPNTRTATPWFFGNMDIPGYDNYLESPGGTKKYLRLDDFRTDPQPVWELLTKHWGLQSPNMVISITGGDITSLQQNISLHKKFRDGILKSAVKTRAWIITDGLHTGSAKEVGNIFQEDLKRSEWAETDDHASIPLIGIAPWGILANRSQLQGIHVGSYEASYHVRTDIRPYADAINGLDPFHVFYLLADDGTSGQYKREPRLRCRLEKYIKTKTSLKMLSTNDVTTPLVVLVVGGDKFTLEKIKDVTSEGSEIPVVIVNGSGPVADLLSEVYKALENRHNRSVAKEYGWSQEEETVLVDYVQKYRKQSLLLDDTDVDCLRQFMKARHLVEVFGVGEGDVRNLDRAILQATFGGISDISVQLNLTLAMDRCDLARETIFIESRKEELRSHRAMLSNALLQALKSYRTDFVRLLLDQDYGGELSFDKFLTLRRLYILHQENLKPNYVTGKAMRSLCKRDTYGAHVLGESQLLPQVGRILHLLMGDHYKLIYQEKEYRQIQDIRPPWMLTTYHDMEAVWHLFLWAVLANKKEIAEIFLSQTTCKIGAALVAYKLLQELSKVAEKIAEVELVKRLKTNAEYFQDIALHTLSNLYEFNRDEAYANLVSVIPFHWGNYVTPLSVADDAGAMRFMGHACCQTFLNLVWMRYMDLDTPRWKLFPFFAFLPFFNIPSIVFAKSNLSYGTYKQDEQQPDTSGEADDTDQQQQSTTTAPEDGANISDVSDNDDDVSMVVSEQAAFAFNKKSFERRAGFTTFCLRNYYTAPVNKFNFNVTTFIIFLGLFTHLVLTELKPIQSVAEISVFEWLVNIWVFSIWMEEIKQIYSRESSGPLNKLNWVEFSPEWNGTWYWHERLGFILRTYKITTWLSGSWNKIDAVMITLYVTSVLLRFTVSPVYFGVVRIMFCVTLMIFYFRLLRIGYILQDIGPRIITISALVRDLLQFILILAIFIISFGVAFQALLNPNQPASWTMVVDILWRPYWQMYGELFVDDATTEMGRPVHNNRNCSYDWRIAEANPDTTEFCFDWILPVLLGVFMLITNILLLNLLIAIFSHSFDKIESESQTIWRYHMYDLVHEYYHMSWLPPPLNILCHLVNLVILLVRSIRRSCYTRAKERYKRKLRDDIASNLMFARQRKDLEQYLDRKAEEAMVQDPCFNCYYDSREKARSETSHFRQEEYMRDEDLEEKAYKRYIRSKKKDRDDTVKKMLNIQEQRSYTEFNRVCYFLFYATPGGGTWKHSGSDVAWLQIIATELQDLKYLPGREPQKGGSTVPISRSYEDTTDLDPILNFRPRALHDPIDNSGRRELNSMRRDLSELDRKVERVLNKLDTKLETITSTMGTILLRRDTSQSMNSTTA